MSIARYIKEIGRGKDGARPLDEAQAHDLMTQVLERRVTDLEIGAFAVAMRIKGETPEELAGFLAATRPHCLAPPDDAARPAVWLPSYNGARKLPNLTALLALALARAGVRVLVHGPLLDAGRVASAQVFEALGLAPARDMADVARAWKRAEPAFVALDVLCPPLAQLLAVRRVVGLRNSGHTIAKLLLPPDVPGRRAPFRVVSHTHPEYATLLAGFLARTQADAMLLRGTEGEPVADARRTPRMEVYRRGVRDEALSVAARQGSLLQLPELPADTAAAATAGYIGAVLDGRLAMPEPIALQVERIAQALHAS